MSKETEHTEMLRALALARGILNRHYTPGCRLFHDADGTPTCYYTQMAHCGLPGALLLTSIHRWCWTHLKQEAVSHEAAHQLAAFIKAQAGDDWSRVEAGMLSTSELDSFLDQLQSELEKRRRVDRWKDGMQKFGMNTNEVQE